MCHLQIYWSLGVRTSKMSRKKELLCFSVFKNPQRELHLDRKAWFWILGIEAINFFRYKVGPYDLTTPMSRVKEPNKNRPFTRVITPSISGIWPTSYELLFFNFQGLSIRAFDSLGGEHLSLDSSNLQHPWEWMGMCQKKSTIHAGKYLQYMNGMGYMILGDYTRFSRFSMYRVP